MKYEATIKFEFEAADDNECCAKMEEYRIGLARQVNWVGYSEAHRTEGTGGNSRSLQNFVAENGFWEAEVLYLCAELAEANQQIAAYQVRVDNDALRLNSAHPVTADRFSHD